MWDRETIDLDIVKANSSIKVVFHNPALLENVIVKAGCGCINAQWHPVTGTLSVDATVGNIPPQLKQQRQFAIYKTINCSYDFDGKHHSDILIIKAIAK